MQYFNTRDHKSQRHMNVRVRSSKDIVSKQPTNRSKKKAHTRLRILRVAYILFRKEGYDAAKTTELAKKVGISHGTIFAHFDSKASILRELVLTQMRKDLRALRELQVKGSNVVERLKDFARTLWVRARTAPELTAAYHAQSWHWTPEEEREYRELIEGGMQVAKSIVLQGIDQEEGWTDMNVDIVMNILQAQYFDCIRQAQYTKPIAIEELNPHTSGNEGNIKDPYLQQFEQVIDYLVE